MTHSRARPWALPLGLLGEVPERLATATAPLPRLRPSLGWRPCDDATRARLPHGRTPRATDAWLPRARVHRAAAIRRTWHGVRPARSTREERGAALSTRVHDEGYTRRAPSLPPALQRALDARREGPSGARRSTVLALQADPPEARTAVSVRSSAREPCLRALGVRPIDLRSLPPPMMRAWADVAPRYAGRVLRRFAPAQRYALTAWCVVEAHQTSREHVVALHDPRRTKQMRARAKVSPKPWE